MLSVLHATYRKNYKILLEFSDHKKGEVDLEEFIFKGNFKPFEKLKNLENFKKFQVDYTLKWDDDLDLAPEYLYFKTFEHDTSLQETFQKWGYLK